MCGRTLIEQVSTGLERWPPDISSRRGRYQGPMSGGGSGGVSYLPCECYLSHDACNYLSPVNRHTCENLTFQQLRLLQSKWNMAELLHSTRMYSSRMRNVHCSVRRRRGGLPGGDVCHTPPCPVLGYTPRPVHAGIHPLPVDKILYTRLWWKHYLSATTVTDGNYRHVPSVDKNLAYL